MSYDINYEHEFDTVTFANQVKISIDELDALFRLKNLATGVPSFLWQELMRLPEGESSLTIHFQVHNFERIERYIELLVRSGFFKMETEEIMLHDRKILKVTLYDIQPEILSIVRMM